jgi:hypothetical protein
VVWPCIGYRGEIKMSNKYVAAMLGTAGYLFNKNREIDSNQHIQPWVNV